MVPRFIRINGITRADRHHIIGEIDELISKSGAWILDFKRFSNISINIFFEIPVRNISLLLSSLQETNIKLHEESITLLQDADKKQKRINDEAVFDIIATLEVTFIHNEPDLIIEVPPFDL